MSGSIPQAAEAWQKLYGGELETLPAPRPGLEAVAVRHPDFRQDPGNWPKILHHRQPAERVVVLIHGLKDSPGYLHDVALGFAAHGANVVLPLLPAHGRQDPVSEMRRADYRGWRSTIDQTVEVAATLGTEISIGGLSTGGALAIDLCLRQPSAITGKVFLFAAALGLRPLARWVLSTRLGTRLCDAWMERKDNRGIGGNPVKYSQDFFVASRQVHLLIQAIRHQAGADFARFEHRDRTFVAHSEADLTIPIAAVEPLIDPADAGQHHRIPEAEAVAHAELVLSQAMSFDKRWPDEPGPPHANPGFETMMEKALACLDR